MEEGGERFRKPTLIESPEEIAERYYQEVIRRRIENKELVMLAGDALKAHFGDDYDPERSDLYAQAAYRLVERAIRESGRKEIAFLGGGPGAGKTEILGDFIVGSGYTEILYDTTLSSAIGIKHLLSLAKDRGLSIGVFGIIANLEQARRHTLSREQKTGRGVSDEAFARGHAGFTKTLQALLEDHTLSSDDVCLYDLRDVHTPEAALEKILKGGHEANPLGILRTVMYDREKLEDEYAKSNFT